MRACTSQELRCGCQQLRLQFVVAAGVAQACKPALWVAVCTLALCCSPFDVLHSDVEPRAANAAVH